MAAGKRRLEAAFFYATQAQNQGRCAAWCKAIDIRVMTTSLNARGDIRTRPTTR